MLKIKNIFAILVFLSTSSFAPSTAHALTEYGEQVVQNICRSRGTTCTQKVRNHLEMKCKENLHKISQASVKSIDNLKKTCPNYHETIKICGGRSASSAPSRTYAKARMAQLTMRDQQLESQNLENETFTNLLIKGLANKLELNHNEVGLSHGFEEAIQQRVDQYTSPDLNDANPNRPSLFRRHTLDSSFRQQLRIDKNNLINEQQTYTKGIEGLGDVSIDLGKNPLGKVFHTAKTKNPIRKELLKKYKSLPKDQRQLINKSKKLTDKTLKTEKHYNNFQNIAKGLGAAKKRFWNEASD